MSQSAKEIFSGYQITGCCITSPDYLGFILEEILPDEAQDMGVAIKLAVYCLNWEPGMRWAALEFEPGWVSPKIVHTELNEFLMVDGLGDVFYFGLGENKQQEMPINPYEVGLKHLSNINGNIYGVSAVRELYLRLGPDKWAIDDELYHLPGTKASASIGFHGIDGFSEKDIYAVGGERDIWHFDGKDWNPLDVCDEPFKCRCVCCADDGYVYIAGRYGIVARGRDDQWQVYIPESDQEDFTSLVCYQGRVFAGTEQHTYLINEDAEPQLYDFEGQFRNLAGTYLYSAYDKLLLANHHNQVALFDGRRWTDIKDCHKYTSDEEEVFLAEATKLADETIDIIKKVTDDITKGSKS